MIRRVASDQKCRRRADCPDGVEHPRYPVADSMTEPAGVGAAPVARRDGSDPLTLLDGVPLSDAEDAYVRAARTANTLRGYRSDWGEFTAWCDQRSLVPLPAAAATITGYLTELARHGAKVGTMSRRLSAIKFAHQLRNLPDPTRHARVVAVWEGIRRTHGAPPEQATPLMPPELLDVVDACPTMKPGVPAAGRPSPTWAGARDRALLLVGFVAALRRRARAGLDPTPYSAHSRAGFVTYAHLRGASDRAIAHQNPAPLPGHPRRLRPHPPRLDRQRRHRVGIVSSARLDVSSSTDGDFQISDGHRVDTAVDDALSRPVRVPEPCLRSRLRVGIEVVEFSGRPPEGCEIFWAQGGVSRTVGRA